MNSALTQHLPRQCLLDESPQIVPTLTCPSCTTHLSTSQPPQVLTTYHNEGGIQSNLDIYHLVKEEAYLCTNPSARPARAYLTMCAEGDVSGIVELLNAISEDLDEGDLSPAQLLRYQDPLDGEKTGLHVALEKSQAEAVWLLLWLASELPTAAFPDEMVRAAGVMGAGREMVGGGSDIREFRDEQGRSAEDVAGSMGDVWAGLLGAGVL